MVYIMLNTQKSYFGGLVVSADLKDKIRRDFNQGLLAGYVMSANTLLGEDCLKITLENGDKADAHIDSMAMSSPPHHALGSFHNSEIKGNDVKKNQLVYSNIGHPIGYMVDGQGGQFRILPLSSIATMFFPEKRAHEYAIHKGYTIPLTNLLKKFPHQSDRYVSLADNLDTYAQLSLSIQSELVFDNTIITGCWSTTTHIESSSLKTVFGLKSELMEIYIELILSI